LRTKSSLQGSLPSLQGLENLQSGTIPPLVQQAQESERIAALSREHVVDKFTSQQQPVTEKVEITILRPKPERDYIVKKLEIEKTSWYSFEGLHLNNHRGSPRKT
jgi:hypothetical protein